MQVYCFISKYNLKEYLIEGHSKDADFKGFGKFVFVPYPCPSLDKDIRIPRQDTLFVDSGECKKNKKIKKYETIKRLDQTPVFRIIYE